MKTASKGQVYNIGNYVMTGKVFGKGHFARVEEATHRIIGKKVAIKIIDLTCIKEEYARRNLHREPRVMAKLKHPCIAALYETMMHGPRLYVVMEAAGGGDLCALVLAARGTSRGLPEPRARSLAAQLVSAVKHMHARGVVHRDLKMENIMLDTTKQFIKIVDFGLSNTWSAGGALRTPCGSLEYAAPELFVDGRRYGPEVDLWSIGVIVYGMVTGGLPFSGAETCAGTKGGTERSRPQLRAAIARGFTRKQRAALACVSTECKMFIQHLLEPNVELRMKIEEAARNRWFKRSGMKMKTHPLVGLDFKSNREIYTQISQLSGISLFDVIAQIKSDPFGALAGMYNIKTHLHQLQAAPGTDLLWSSAIQEPPATPTPEYQKYKSPASSIIKLDPPNTIVHQIQNSKLSLSYNCTPQTSRTVPKFNEIKNLKEPSISTFSKDIAMQAKKIIPQIKQNNDETKRDNGLNRSEDTKSSLVKRPFLIKKPVYRVCDSGDGNVERRLHSINEHSNTDVNNVKTKYTSTRVPYMKKIDLEERRLNPHPNKISLEKRPQLYKVDDPCWRDNGMRTVPPRLFLPHGTTVKHTSLGNIGSPHSSTNSQCKSERAMPVGWYSNRSTSTPLQRFRRAAPMK